MPRVTIEIDLTHDVLDEIFREAAHDQNVWLHDYDVRPYHYVLVIDESGEGDPMTFEQVTLAKEDFASVVAEAIEDLFDVEMFTSRIDSRLADQCLQLALWEDVVYG